MKVSKKLRYGLRAMVNLTLQNHEGVLSAKTISKEEGIPLQYLEQIFNKLKKARLIKSIRGPKGGYVLSRQASKIRIIDIIEALEDKGFLAESLDEVDKINYNKIGFYATHKFLKKLSKSISQAMSSITLLDLCGSAKTTRTTVNNGIDHRYIFQI